MSRTRSAFGAPLEGAPPADRQGRIRGSRSMRVFRETRDNMTTADRESIGAAANPIGLAGIEFIEYTTDRPQALGQLLEAIGFRPVARHRSREALLYRQGPLHVVVASAPAPRPDAGPPGVPSISALALRVRDAGAAYRRALQRGAWAVPVEVQPMELQIPAIHGVGREPHLLRRPLGRVLDLRHRLRRDPRHAAAATAAPAGCAGSASCSTSATSAPTTGASSTQSCSASPRCPTPSASASCPRGACCAAPAAASTCS
jgi:hypothetical protein